MYYPLLTQPYFRHGSETPWGGDKLKAYFGKPSPRRYHRRSPGSQHAALDCRQPRGAHAR